MCALTLEEQLLYQGAVTSANVNFALGNSTVTYHPNRIAPKQLVQAIREVGYDADMERAEGRSRALSVLLALPHQKRP
ncbi:MAG: hypothetical protein ACXVH8_05605 [Halobacteriota archaeon]